MLALPFGSCLLGAMCLNVVWSSFYRYCISVFASDETDGAEFVMFDKVGLAAVGRHLMTLMRQKYPGLSTVDEMVAVAKQIGRAHV